MQPLVAVILVGVPLAWLVVFAAYAYLDAPNHGMDRRKWALICFFVPLFGFFAYVFERGERDYDPSEDPTRREATRVRPDLRSTSGGAGRRGSVRPGPRRTTLTKAKTKRKTSGTTRTGSISTTTAETRREPTEPTAVETATPCRAAPTAVVRGRTRHRERRAARRRRRRPPPTAPRARQAPRSTPG